MSNLLIESHNISFSFIISSICTYILFFIPDIDNLYLLTFSFTDESSMRFSGLLILFKGPALGDKRIIHLVTVHHHRLSAHLGIHPKELVQWGLWVIVGYKTE